MSRAPASATHGTHRRMSGRLRVSATGLLRLYFLHFTLALADALMVEERIRLGVATAAFPSGRKYSVSAGVAALGPEDSVDSRLQRADTALYQAKNSGRDRVCASEG